MYQADYTWKEIKKIRNKRTGKTRFIIGSIISAIGLMRLMDFVQFPYSWHLDSLIVGGIMILIGIAVLIMTWRKVDIWNRYEAYVNNRGNTPISYIARSLGEKEDDVRTTLQQMINNHFFLGPESDIEAYIDGTRNLLVMTKNGVPLEPIEETMKRMEKDQAQRQAAQGSRPQTAAGPQGQSQASPSPQAQTDSDRAANQAAGGEAGAAPKLSPNIRLLRSAIESTEDKVVKASLYDLEGSVRRIEQRLAEDPGLAQNDHLRNLQKHYLPMTMDLVRKYQAEKNSPETMQKIGEALGICADAFSRIERKLTEKDDLSTEVDIETLENMFAQAGLLQVAR